MHSAPATGPFMFFLVNNPPLEQISELRAKKTSTVKAEIKKKTKIKSLTTIRMVQVEFYATTTKLGVIV